MICIIDIEATCGDTIPHDEQETIEIGAAMCNDAFTVVSSMSVFVRPSLHPILTDFCVGLTGIGRTDVAAARPFFWAWPTFLGWANSFLVERWCSWGAFDNAVLLKECQRHDIEWRMPPHVNLAKVFAQKAKRRAGSHKAATILGVTPVGRHHRGIDDALTIAKVAAVMHSRGWL